LLSKISLKELWDKKKIKSDIGDGSLEILPLVVLLVLAPYFSSIHLIMLELD